MKQTLIKLPEDLHYRLKLKSVEEHSSMTEIVTKLIKEYLYPKIESESTHAN